MEMMAHTYQLKSRRESSTEEVKPAMPAMLRMDSVAERLLIHDSNGDSFEMVRRQASGKACAYAFESVESVEVLFNN